MAAGRPPCRSAAAYRAFLGVEGAQGRAARPGGLGGGVQLPAAIPFLSPAWARLPPRKTQASTHAALLALLAVCGAALVSGASSAAAPGAAPAATTKAAPGAAPTTTSVTYQPPIAGEPPGWVDPNPQTEGFQASLTATSLPASNPLGLAQVQVAVGSATAPHARVQRAFPSSKSPIPHTLPGPLPPSRPSRQSLTALSRLPASPLPLPSMRPMMPRGPRCGPGSWTGARPCEREGERDVERGLGGPPCVREGG